MGALFAAPKTNHCPFSGKNWCTPGRSPSLTTTIGSTPRKPVLVLAAWALLQCLPNEPHGHSFLAKIRVSLYHGKETWEV
jgi:hypothetical protein